MGEQTAHRSFGRVCLISGWWTTSQTPLIDIVGVGPCYTLKVSEYGVSPLLGFDLLLMVRLREPISVVVINHLMSSFPKMPVKRVLGMEILMARGALVVVVISGRHGVRWPM